MSTYTERFKTRLRVNPELLERYEYDARYYGDKNIKNELASAKRTATSLSKASASFSYLRPGQKLALDAANSSMRSLANDLAVLQTWAKQYFAFCEIEREREHVESLEQLALKRWNNDDNALKFEAELLHELQTKDGKLALGDWFHGRGMHSDVAREEFSMQISTTPPKKIYSLALNTATLLQHLAEQNALKSNAYSSKGTWWYVAGWKDYEDYIEWRKTVAGVADSALKKLFTLV